MPHHHKPTPLVLTPEQIASIRKANAALGSAPSKLAKAKHAAQAGGRVIRAAVKGQSIRVSSQERDRRLAICRRCELWREGGNVGLGECTHSSCGCTRFKHGLSTEHCPLEKW